MFVGPRHSYCGPLHVVNGWLALGVVWYGQALPLHARIQDPENEVKNAMIAQFALWSALGHREVRQDKCGELAVGQLHGDRRRYRLFGCCTHHGRASCEEWCCEPENQITVDATRS